MTVATRTTARVLPVNARGEVMLLFGIDPLYAQQPYWFTIGGGADDGESLEDAGVRELREETGIEITSDRLIGPFLDGHDAGEAGFITDWAWWQPQDLEADGRQSNPQLPTILEHAVSIVRKARP